MTGIVSPDWTQIERFDAGDATRLLTAITFAGLGGFWTLFYSYWLKEKGVGMAAYAERMTGFRSAVTPIRGMRGALPREQPQARARLRSWYRYLSLETLIGILGNLATTLLACLLAFALLHPEGKLPQGFDIAVVQSEFFAVSWGDVGRASNGVRRAAARPEITEFSERLPCAPLKNAFSGGDLSLQAQIGGERPAQGTAKSLENGLGDVMGVLSKEIVDM